MATSLKEAVTLLQEIRDALRDIGRGPPRGLGPCDLLTEKQAARVLKMSDRDAVDFLRHHELIRVYDGRRRVIVGELIEKHDKAAREESAPRRTPKRSPVPSWRDL